MKQLLAIYLILFSFTALGQQSPVGVFQGHTDVGTNVNPDRPYIFQRQVNMLSPGPVTMFGLIMTNVILYGKKLKVILSYQQELSSWEAG
jgi:hypothetical protein